MTYRAQRINALVSEFSDDTKAVYVRLGDGPPIVIAHLEDQEQTSDIPMTFDREYVLGYWRNYCECGAGDIDDCTCGAEERGKEDAFCGLEPTTYQLRNPLVMWGGPRSYYPNTFRYFVAPEGLNGPIRAPGVPNSYDDGSVCHGNNVRPTSHVEAFDGYWRARHNHDLPLEPYPAEAELPDWVERWEQATGETLDDYEESLPRDAKLLLALRKQSPWSEEELVAMAQHPARYYFAMSGMVTAPASLERMKIWKRWRQMLDPIWEQSDWRPEELRALTVAVQEERRAINENPHLQQLRQKQTHLDRIFRYAAHTTTEYQRALQAFEIVNRLLVAKKQRLERHYRHYGDSYRVFRNDVETLANLWFTTNGAEQDMTTMQKWAALGLAPDVCGPTNNYYMWQVVYRIFPEANLQDKYDRWYHNYSHQSRECGTLKKLRERLGEPTFELGLRWILRRADPRMVEFLKTEITTDLETWARQFRRRRRLWQNLCYRYHEANSHLADRYKPIRQWCEDMARENWGEIHDLWAHPPIDLDVFGINWDEMLTVENPPPGFGTMALCTHGNAVDVPLAKEMAETYHFGGGLLRGLLEQGVDPNDLAWHYTELPGLQPRDNEAPPSMYSLASLLLVQRIGPSEYLTQVGDKLWKGTLVWRTGWSPKARRGYDDVVASSEIIMIWGEFNPKEDA